MREFIKKYDLLYKILALLLAFVFWFYVMGVKDPDVTLTVKNVPVNYVGEASMADRLGYQIISGRETAVNVRVRGKRSKVLSLKNSDITVNADLGGVTSPGNHNIVCSVLLPDRTISLTDPGTITLKTFIDEVTTVEVPVIAQISGDVAQGCSRGATQVSPATVTLSGPSSVLSNISNALVEIRTGTLSENFYGEYTYKLIGLDGSEANQPSIVRHTDKISVTVPVFAQKTVPLEIQLHETGVLSSENVNVSILPKEITISGEKSALGGIHSIVVGSLNLAEITDRGFRTEMNIPIPEGITNLSGITKADVNVTLKGIAVRTFNVKNIVLRNEPANRAVTLIETEKTVTLRGSESYLENLMESDITLVVDLSDVKSNGKKQLPAEVVIDGVSTGVSATEDYTVTVQVSSK